jgi:hypothetical protein
VEETAREDYFSSVSEYLHLNPARAGLLARVGPALESYRWSNYPQFIGGRALPHWLRRTEVFGRLQLSDEGAGSRRRFAVWMARRTREVLERAPTPEQKVVRQALQACGGLSGSPRTALMGAQRQCPQTTESAAVPMTWTTSLPRLSW